ncbi:UNVERIFIED_CONTAM: hypothetical protein HDU68_012471 [Siphonaria sp. JEL0065]|nr:hypothetical protein HDU68_012471 [Siphonaria sp. JEL0065]
MPLYSIVPHILYLLAHSPTTQKSIFAEVNKVNAKTINRTHIANFHQLESLVLEALRLLPPFATSYNRSSPENSYRLPGSWTLPKGTHVVVDFISTLRNQEAFGEDASTFQADRFTKLEYIPTTQETPAESIAKLKAAIAEQKPTIKSSYIPFGAGSFACPAQRLALDIVKVAVAEVVRKYELVAVKGRDGVSMDEIVRGLDEFGSEQGSVLRHLEGCPVAIKKRK